MLQGSRRMEAADFGGFQPSVMTMCLPSQYHHHNHHHHPHLSHGTTAPDSFRPYGTTGGGNPSSSSVAAAAVAAAAAADLSIFSPSMGDNIKHHYGGNGGGSLSGGVAGSQPSHKLMSIIKSQAGLSEVERIPKVSSRSTVPSASSASSPTRPSPHHFNLAKEVSSGGVSTAAGMHPSLSPWFIQQQQQQHQPIGSNKKRRQLSESASGNFDQSKEKKKYIWYLNQTKDPRKKCGGDPPELIYKTDRFLSMSDVVEGNKKKE